MSLPYESKTLIKLFCLSTCSGLCQSTVSLPGTLHHLDPSFLFSLFPRYPLLKLLVSLVSSLSSKLLGLFNFGFPHSAPSWAIMPFQPDLPGPRISLPYPNYPLLSNPIPLECSSPIYPFHYVSPDYFQPLESDSFWNSYNTYFYFLFNI